MMRIMYALLFSASILIASCGNSENHTSAPDADTVKAATESTAKTIYTCPMHPEVISDQPGKCPTCGMDLEPKS